MSMFMFACGVMFLIAVCANARDWRMLALTGVVGAVFFSPVPHDSAFQFYAMCVFGELLVILAAILIKAKASELVIELCMLLVMAHIMGYALDGSPPFSPYRVIVKLLEFSQLAACAALSSVFAPILRNKDAPT